jgi:hypothetical protein
MASVWKARAEWVDEAALSSGETSKTREEPSPNDHPTVTSTKERVEKLVVGWGGTVWVIDVYPDRPGKNNRGQRIGSVEVSTM